MREPTKIAFGGDWHMSARWAVSMIRYAHDQGVSQILHTGDFGFTFTSAFCDAVEPVCQAYDVRIVFIDGNHDNHNLLNDLPQNDDGFGILTGSVLYAPRGHRWLWGGKIFLALGGAVSVDQHLRTPEVEWWSTETITPEQVDRAVQGGHADVMVTHDAPYGVSLPGIGRGDPTDPTDGWPEHLIQAANRHRHILADVVKAVTPTTLVHGHYHRFYESELDGCHVVGLDCDGTTPERNMWVVDLKDL